MSVLSLAMIAHLAATPACTVPGMVPQFWPSVIKVESHLDPLAVGDDTAKQSFYPTDIAFAEELAIRLMQAGHSVGIGLSQLTARSPEQFKRKFKINIRQALDACTNMHVGSKFYVDGALSIFNSGTPTGAPHYVELVEAALHEIEVNPPATSAAMDRPPVPPSPPCAPVWDAWATATCRNVPKEIPHED